MRRTGATLLSIAAVLLGLPVLTAGTAAAAATCAPTALPVPPDAAEDGGTASAILEPGTYLGHAEGYPAQGLIWPNGSYSSLPISPNSVNSAGLVVGSATTNSPRAARMQLGGTPEYLGYYTFMDEVNESGDAAGTYFRVEWPEYHALWWGAGDAEATQLTSPPYAGAWAIGDLGYVVGYGETGEGERRELIWGPDGQIARQFGPYSSGDTEILPHDIDDGVALAGRVKPGGGKDLVLVDVVSGAITPLANTNGLDPELYEDGWVVGMKDLTTPVLWHDGARQQLQGVPGTHPRTVNDLKVFGSTAYLAGMAWPDDSSYVNTPTIWKCN